MHKYQHALVLEDEVEAYFQVKEAYLDSFIDNGSEQELFASSYIHGHFSVIAANVMRSLNSSTSQHSPNDTKQMLSETLQTFEQLLKKSINTAITENELARDDANDVVYMLEKLLQSSATHCRYND